MSNDQIIQKQFCIFQDHRLKDWILSMFGNSSIIHKLVVLGQQLVHLVFLHNFRNSAEDLLVFLNSPIQISKQQDR